VARARLGNCQRHCNERSLGRLLQLGGDRVLRGFFQSESQHPSGISTARAFVRSITAQRSSGAMARDAAGRVGVRHNLWRHPFFMAKNAKAPGATNSQSLKNFAGDETGGNQRHENNSTRFRHSRT